MSQIKKKFIKFGITSDAVNAQDVPANYSPSNYTPAQVATEGNDKVSAHLNGINTKLGAAIDASQIADGSVSNTEFQYLDGVTSDIQTQIDSINSDIADDVEGPASATDNAVVRFDGITGKLIQDSGVIIDDSNNISGVQQITVAADAVSALQLVTKQQLDAAAGGADVKASAKAATTANITLSGPQTIDGYSAVASDRILVKNQTLPEENGIYVVAAGAWTRALDADTSADLTAALVTIQQGSTQANTGWFQVTDAPVVGTDPIVWNQFFGAGTYTADGLGLELVGSTFQLELDGSTLSKSASGLKVSDNGISNTQIAPSAGIDATKIADGSVTSVEFQYLGGVTSDLQTQLNTLSSSISAKENIKKTIVSVASNVTLTNDAIHLVNTTSARSLTMPSAPATGSTIVIKDISGQLNVNNITLVRAGSEQIEGVAANFTIDEIYKALTLVSDASGNWWLI